MSASTSPGPDVSYVGQPLRKRVRLTRPLTSYTRVQRAVSNLIRNRVTLGINGQSYLNAGCGPNVRSNFINLDYHWRPGVQLCWDLTRALPFSDSSLNGIYTEHCLEHLTFPTCLEALREFHRILRISSTLRIVVPDAELYLMLYLRSREHNATQFPYCDPKPAPHWTAMQEVNRIFRGHGHQYAYDFETLAMLLERAGFQQIERRKFGEGRDQHLLIDSKSRECESLYIEAIK